MILTPAAVATLQAHMHRARELEATRKAALAPIAAMEAAVSKLAVAQGNALREVGQLQSAGIEPSADRVANLIAGTGVGDLDEAEVQQRAVRIMVLKAKSDQIGRDHQAVVAHMAAQQARADAAERLCSTAEADLLLALLDAATDAYKQAAIAFIDEQVCTLLSITSVLRSRHGLGEHPRVHEIIASVRLSWTEEDGSFDPAVPVHLRRHLVTAWPRNRNGVSLSGKKIESEDAVKVLLAEIAAITPEAPPDALGSDAGPQDLNAEDFNHGETA